MLMIKRIFDIRDKTVQWVSKQNQSAHPAEEAKTTIIYTQNIRIFLMQSQLEHSVWKSLKKSLIFLKLVI